MTRRKRRHEEDNDESGVAWGSYDDDAADTDRSESDFGSSFDSLEDGINYRRILPPPKGSGWGRDSNGNPKDSPLLSVWEHRIEMPGEKQPLVFACPKKMLGKPCRMCEHSEAHIRSRLRSEKEIGFAFAPKRKVYLQWFDSREHEDGKPNIKVYRAGKLIAKDLSDLKDKYGDFSHARTGYELKVKRSGKDRDTRYQVSQQDVVPLEDYDLSPG